MKLALLEEFTRLGGGQIVASKISEIFSDKGEFIDLFTDYSHPFLIGNYNRIFEQNLKFNENDNYLKILKNSLMLKRNLKKINGYDFIINNHPTVFIYKGDLNMMHTLSILEFAINEEGKVLKKYLTKLIKISGLYKTYNQAHFWSPGKYNMRISKDIFSILGINSTKFHVIPLSVKFPNFIDFSIKKKNQVLVFGRINREKNLETVIAMAKQCKLNFIIAGALNPGNESYYEMIDSIKPENVKIIVNPDNILKDKLFRESGIFLHVRRRENFPISLLEAISYGCIPVVPKYGGTWEDIVLKGQYGIGYKSVQEGIDSLNEAFNMSNSNIQEIYESRERFSEDNFSQRFSSLVNELNENKKR